tara:strand:- start:20 stop:1354 length:1335 start_codon:yes stop_codon:yes gene_type:complete
MDILEKIYNLYLESNQKICIDSRSKKIKNSIFFGIKGVNYDGNLYAKEAIKRGAKYAITDNNNYADNTQIIYVNNTIEALQKLAQLHRLKWSNNTHHVKSIIGITGTNGKTTTKEILKNILCTQLNVYSTEGNLNNHIGVPLTILALKQEHDIGVVELGANHQGEIEKLCQIAQPTHGIITNIGKAHLKGFKNIENIKKTKNELYEYIKKNNGIIFVNHSNPILIGLVNKYNKTILYQCMELKTNQKTNDSVFYFTCEPFIKLIFQNTKIQTKILGNYNVENIAASITIAKHFKIQFDNIKHTLKKLELNNNRSQLLKTKKSNQIILDAYNANPTSVSLAIKNFFNFIKIQKSNQNIIILGDMLELGPRSNQYHQEIVNLLEKFDFNNCILIGDEFQNTKSKKYLKISSLKECQVLLENQPIKHHAILIKGSRKMRLEKLLEIL